MSLTLGKTKTFTDVLRPDTPKNAVPVPPFPGARTEIYAGVFPDVVPRIAEDTLGKIANAVDVE